YAGATLDLANLLTDMGRYGEADKAYLDAIALHGRLSGGVRRGDWVAERARLLTLMGRYQEAEAQFVRALGLLDSEHQNEHPDVQRALRLFVALYRAWGRPQDASRYAQRLIPEGERAR
ncbi:MAG TPA: tetratricopeptide repeat protein, partial [Gemmatimonadaceae bacterium]|nr:tetratricopeptide repeat protein [Gemmatimonadaceae bacterium]